MAKLEELNFTFFENRISALDRKRLSNEELAEKEQRLRAILSEIQNGTYGEFAQSNYSINFSGENLDQPRSIRINTSMVLPVLADDISEMALQMQRYAAPCDGE